MYPLARALADANAVSQQFLPWQAKITPSFLSAILGKTGATKIDAQTAKRLHDGGVPDAGNAASRPTPSGNLLASNKLTHVTVLGLRLGQIERQLSGADLGYHGVSVSNAVDFLVSPRAQRG